MAYATKADLAPARLSLEDLAELTSSEDGNIDDAVVQAALDEASSKVDAYCGNRYVTPLQPSGLAKSITIDLAIYILFARRRETKITETVTECRDMALSFLKDVSTGKASLDQPANSAQPQVASADVTVTCRPQTFNDENLKGFC